METAIILAIIAAATAVNVAGVEGYHDNTNAEGETVSGSHEDYYTGSDPNCAVASVHLFLDDTLGSLSSSERTELLTYIDIYCSDSSGSDSGSDTTSTGTSSLLALLPVAGLGLVAWLLLRRTK